MSSGPYPLARAGHELKRLELQAELLKPMTRRTFEDAGIGAGMRVLDLGSGFGDVCMLLAEMTGPSGRVVGLDIDGQSVREAERRVSEAGFTNITFVNSDFAHYLPDAPFDAVVGRLVLMYQANPAAALASVIRHLRPGGIAAFLEPLMMPPGGPESTGKRCGTLIVETFRRSGAHVDLGLKLHKVFVDAGLPPPQMRLEAVVDGRAESPIQQFFAETLASIRPKAIELGIPGSEELNPAADGPRMGAEMWAMGYAMLALPMVSAWSRT